MAGQTGLMSILRGILWDNQWHTVADLYAACEAVIAPETAYRTYMREYTRSDAPNSPRRRHRQTPPLEFEAALRYGRMRLIQQSLYRVARERRAGGRGWDYAVRGVRAPLRRGSEPPLRGVS